MDHIEPVDGSDGPSAEAPSPPSTTQPTSLQRRQRATSLRSRRPTIRLQRLPSLENAIPQIQSGVSRGTGNVSSINVASPPPAKGADEDSWQGNRRRSSSEPRPGRWSTPNPSALPRLPPDQMHPLMEEPTSPINLAHSSRPFPEVHPSGSPPPRVQRRGSLGLLRWTSEAAMNRFSRNRVSASGAAPSSGADTTDNEYHPHVVDVLDVIDPEVSALSTLTNVQNSLFVPNLGPLINRNQTYALSPPRESSESTGEETTETEEGEETFEKSPEGRPSLERPLTSLSAVLGKQDPQFAVLPEGSNLEGWTARDIEELNDHVRHMLHSRRSKFKRAMKGFGKYVSKPLGFLITLYATLITLFGLAWVLFLIGWINVGGRQLYIINVIDNVLVALFAIMGDGLAPFRAIDTYHMCFIAHYTFQTWKVRRKRQLPDLKDKNDLPTRREIDVDVEFGDTPKDEEYEFTVLNRLQQQKLVHHQTKLSKSHTFYKPHETLTHHAFPLRMLIAIVVLLDCHSLLQIALGACTWGISYHHRPFALTTVILCCSITCNITGGVLIMVGDRRTRKKDVVERLFREQLTKEAMKKVCKKKQKRQQKIEEEDEPRLSVSTRPQPYDGT
ncbi:integral membrane protein [Aspergillus flavus AF70]|nr:integral membrane protein [Aspergillus flavus AF70]